MTIKHYLHVCLELTIVMCKNCTERIFKNVGQTKKLVRICLYKKEKKKENYL